MKKILFAIILLTTITNCTYKGYYQVGLQNVERPENAKVRYGESTLVNFDEEGGIKFSYEDKMIKVVWLPTSTAFRFKMYNNLEHSIKIIWDEAVYVNVNGSSGRVTHSGVKILDIKKSQPSSVIAKGAFLEDLVIPTDKIRLVESPLSNIAYSPLFPIEAKSRTKLLKISKNYIGKDVKIVLPLEIQGTVNEYIFTFKIQDFISY